MNQGNPEIRQIRVQTAMRGIVMPALHRRNIFNLDLSEDVI